jgi:hypothetical protein
MRLHGAIGSFLILIKFIVVEAAAAPFQNLDFENYPGGPALPGWQLTMDRGDGTALYNGVGPIPGSYPFVGFHIGDGPVIGVNGSAGPIFFPNELQGNFSISLRNTPNYEFPFSTLSAAQAARDNVLVGGIAQTGDVPSWAKSVWMAVPGEAPFTAQEGYSGLKFSEHPVYLKTATDAQATAMLVNEGLVAPPGLNDPNSPPDFRPPLHFVAGNIETIAGLSRRLKISSQPTASEIANTGIFEMNGGGSTFDMIVFSSLPWDGPAVNVPEPAAGLLLLPALAVLRRRRHHA